MKNRANWLYFLLGDKKLKEAFFLYGVSVPTHHEKKEEKKPKKIKFANKEIHCWHSVNGLDFSKEITHFESIHSIVKNHKIEVSARKSVVHFSIDVDQKNPESLFRSPVDVDVYYIDEIMKYKDGFYFKPEGIEELAKILEILQKETGQSFKGAYSKRLGTFEYMVNKPWSENEVTPFTVYIEPKGQKVPHRYFFRRSGEFLTEELLIHLVVYDDEKEVLFDQLKIIKSGEEKIFFEHQIHNNDSGYEYWIFDRDGKLLDRDKMFFLKSISFGLNILGSQYNISQENLSKSSSLKGGNVGIINHISNIKVDLKSQNELERVSDRAKVLYQSITEYFSGSNQINCRWFNKVDNQEDLKKYLNQITHFEKCEACIIDPYFSFDSDSKEFSTDYLFFLKNSNLNLKVISCFPGNSKKHAEKIKSFQDFDIPLSRMMWHNLKHGKFHDRFIYVKGKIDSNEKEDVYMLSNSFNNILKDYNICVARLDGEAKTQAIKHVRELQSECNDNNLIYK
jgi:hypothetical protein